MSAQSNVLLMTADVTVVTEVSRALSGNGHVLDPTWPQTTRDLLAHLSRSSAAMPVVLVDLDPLPRQILSDLERVVARFPGSRFVGLADQLSSELLLESMQAGLRRVVSKRTMHSELHAVLDRLMGGASSGGTAQGELLTILSASGGCGATTLAVNLAHELARQPSATGGQRALLIDMDCHYGAMATYLGLEPRYGLEQILNYSGPIDTDLLSTTASAWGDELHVLASPASIRFCKPEPLNIERLEQALRCARQAYRHTIVDAPRVGMEVASILAAASTRTLVVFQLTVKDIRIARQMLDALVEWGVPPGNVLPVANRCARRQMISLDDASKALGGVRIACVRNDWSAAIAGLNYGQTLAQAAPRSVLRKDLQELLETLIPQYKPT
ncbi:AAA family ATPase [Fontivita pretiosa]|uniref:AAA family ATPase n=1 Tax=Fontivita pretiosa TaxID=2989684 RepID=UPI003D1857D4